MKIAFCQATFKRDWERTLKHIENWIDYVDYVIIVVDETVSEEEVDRAIKRFNNPKLVITQVEFPESLPEYRNMYLSEAKRLGVDWFVVSDPDEFINEETRKDIYKLCRWAEENNYNQIGLNAHDQFEVVDVIPFDKLDELKEYPGGYRESNYYKFLINKICCEKFHYEGVGKTKSVHETWLCPVHPRRGVYAPKKYFYTHIKSAYDIWRNAARNLFLSGGGDNVGDLNEMWVELRRIVNFKKWREFEEYINSGEPLSKELIQWIKKALVWKATDYGVETRETAKWIIFHHRELLNDEEIAYGMKNPPKLTREDEVENYVRKAYFKVLGRHPDREGLEHWKDEILKGRIKREDLPKILMSSPEYKEKFAMERESIRLQVPVNVDVQLTEDIIIQALTRSRKWLEIKKYIDVGRFILENVKDRDEFLRWFYKNKYSIKIDDLMRWFK